MRRATSCSFTAGHVIVLGGSVGSGVVEELVAGPGGGILVPGLYAPRPDSDTLESTSPPQS